VARWRARAAIVTAPVGVLQARPPARGAIAFEPAPPRLRGALDGLAMGSVLHLSLWLRDLPWSDDEELGRLSFVHLGSGPFQVLWTAYPAREPFVVAWSGGPAARALTSGPRAGLMRRLRATIAQAAGTTPAKIGNAIRRIWWHDWDRDPYARGAYSYVRVGGASAAKSLARPESGTLFFAGEATAEESGTVEGALTSGRRAARQVVAALAREPGVSSRVVRARSRTAPRHP